MLNQTATDEYTQAMRLGQKEYREALMAGRSPHPAVLDELKFPVWEVAMLNQTATDEYTQAMRLGQKEYREALMAGRSPHPAVLDELLPEGGTESVTDVGLVEIPSERIVGVKSSGRITAFSPTFRPLLEAKSEFATKWINLCAAHLGDTGITDPIVCFEYLGDFYVQEGNKRVSVLRHFGAARIPGNVRRILPPMSDDPRIKAYYEFLEFYRTSKVYSVQFRRPGDYAKLLAFVGKKPGEAWTEDERRTFNAYFQYFREALNGVKDKTEDLLPEEALLAWLDLNPYTDLGALSATELKKSVSALWEDMVTTNKEDGVKVQTKAEDDSKSSFMSRLLSGLEVTELKKSVSALWEDMVTTNKEDGVKVQTKAEDDSKSSFMSRLLSGLEVLNVAFIHQLTPAKSAWVLGHEAGREYLEQVFGSKSSFMSRLLSGLEVLNVAFIHQLTPAKSAWVLGHEAGREYLEQVFGERIRVRSYFGANNAELAEKRIEQAVAEGAQLVFTTAPPLTRATVKAAVKYPKIRFLNCSVDQRYSSIRTYYGRIYEAKFITGAVAGAMAGDDRIGYIASYPIFGVPASINAFALGAQLTNPRAQIELRWSCVEGTPQADFFVRRWHSGDFQPGCPHPVENVSGFLQLRNLSHG